MREGGRERGKERVRKGEMGERGEGEGGRWRERDGDRGR